MKQDLYKKHISADPVPARLPYAIVTRLLEITGWKRFETNKVMQFQGVSTDTFNSIWRRSLVIEFKGRFYDLTNIMTKYGSLEKAARQGVFPRDPTMKDFLRSPAGIGASLHMTFGWLQARSEQDCRDIIEEYVTHGLDQGLTRSTMQHACNIDVDEKNASNSEVLEMPACEQSDEDGQSLTLTPQPKIISLSLIIKHFPKG